VAKTFTCISLERFMPQSSTNFTFLRNILSKIDINDKRTQEILESFFVFLNKTNRVANYALLKIWLVENYPKLPQPDAAVDLWNIIKVLAQFKQLDIKVASADVPKKSLLSAINSLIKGIETEDYMKRDVLSNVIYKHLFPKAEGSKIKHASNKEIWSNFTDKKLDYKSKNDFWSVENGYIVRTFKTGEVIDESGN
jgi:hypothetical protein